MFFMTFLIVQMLILLLKLSDNTNHNVLLSYIEVKILVALQTP